MNFQSIGGRRFTLACAVAVGTTVLQAIGKLDAAGANYTLTMIGIVGAYITGDVMEKKHAGERTQS